MENTKKSLFSNFDVVSKKEWKEKVNVDLKGADFYKKLVWKNLNQIDVQPFYNVEDKKEYLRNTGINSSLFLNYRRISVESANKANESALKAIEEGVNALLFDLKESISIENLLNGVNLEKVAVSFILNQDEIAIATDFFKYVEAQEIPFNSLKGYFDLNTLSDYLTSKKLDSKKFSTVSKLINLAEKFINYKAVTISGNTYFDSGSNQVQEIAFTLNSLIYTIDELTKCGTDIQDIFDNLNFILSIGGDYFIEIAKFRAFNNLLNGIADKYGIAEFSNTLTAKTSIWTKSITDANTNMLRATTEAMSAILGNVDGIEIDPYDNEFNERSDFSQRIASNIAIILKEESYFGKVQNPVDGSYYIEELTIDLAEKALELFKKIEKNDGFFTNFENEEIQNQIALIRFGKIKLLSQRRLAMVGINKYPNLMESIKSELFKDSSEDSNCETKVLCPRRAALELEQLRRVSEQIVEKSGFRPKVELTSFGNLTMRKARAEFAYDFMGISGFDILSEKSHENPVESAKYSAKSDSNVVIICSSDQDYSESALDFVKLFRSINKDKVLLLAGNPTELSEELMNEGLDGFINMKSDVIKTLSNVQNKIKETTKISEL